MTFSRSCRSTLNGVCAACGKAGALLGTIVFVTAAAHFGQEVVMLACAIVSVIAMTLSLFCVDECIGYAKPEEEQQIVSKRFLRLPMRVVVSHPSLIDYIDEL